ncbi:MAG: hypothetical protein UW95_C0006G0002 [Parcubacteria group bacterium GW2011_GWC1_45_14]|nr:MAG: hypothetical protein UW95_C0006G0002 [Parcubacteria group bacterium GW2011_GWC1_45_14]
MYWIYLVIFVIMVFVPDMLRDGFFGLEEETLEELAIFVLGGLGFVFYLIKEKQLANNEKDKTRAQREASRMSKDLTSSYSFIGEINRKLEIFKNISLGLPGWSKMTLAREKEAFEYIMAAIKILTKADEYCLTFVVKDSCEEMLELRSKKNLKFELTQRHCLDENKKYFETDKYIVTVSPENIRGIVSILTIKKKTPAHTFDDPDILKAIASQALFLYIFLERRRKTR